MKTQEKRKAGVVLMTALLPTVGHQYLIDFAAEFLDVMHPDVLTRDQSILYVILSARSFEPLSGYERILTFADNNPTMKNIRYILHDDDQAPQNPSGDDDWQFWNYWCEVIAKKVPHDSTPAYIFASEGYALTVAQEWTKRHPEEPMAYIPFDTERGTIYAKSSDIRQNMMGRYNAIHPKIRNKFDMSFCLFGAESMGKTTYAKFLAHEYDGMFIAEWAREYLMRAGVGYDVTDEKMKMIEFGQYSSMRAAYADLQNKKSPFIFFDTDLLSTIGYWRIWGKKEPASLVEAFKRTKCDHYIVMDIDIPFEADPLRYGGDKRESKTQFWIDLLEEFDCEYTRVTSSTQIGKIPADVFNAKHANLINFKRD